MDNYALMQESARKRFLTYEPTLFAGRKGIAVSEGTIQTQFLGENAKISLKTGKITVSDHGADFLEAMCLYDWLCDGKRTASASGDFAPVSSLPGVMVRGNGLTISTASVAKRAEDDPQGFGNVCISLGGIRRQVGDIAYEIPLFSDLTAVVKFYFPDDEFPASLVLLWDKNILQYIRYETVYYLAGCLLRRLEWGMERMDEH